jgi:integrase
MKTDEKALCLDNAASPLEPLILQAKAYARAARAPRTLEEYGKQLRAFHAFCKTKQLVAIPAEPTTVALYMTAGASRGLRPNTLHVQLAAIGEAHRVAGRPSPCSSPIVREVMKGIRRVHGAAERQAVPLMADQLRMVLERIPNDPRGLRDRALLLLGFLAALRRQEIVSMTVEDIETHKDGITVHIPRSKTDPEGRGHAVGIKKHTSRALCTLRAINTWLEVAEIERGRVFRRITKRGDIGESLTARSVPLIVKARASAAGIELGQLSAHSLRAGLATSAHVAGHSDQAIMQHGRWRSRTTLDRYIRDLDLFAENVTEGLI